MEETYAISIDRPGYADIPELARCQTAEAAAAMIRALLECRDKNIRSVKVQIDRITGKVYPATA